MNEDIKKTRTVLFMWKSDDFFNTHSINDLIEAAISGAYFDMHGISQVIPIDDLSCNDNGIFTFSINLYNHFQSTETKVKFYAKGNHMITEFNQYFEARDPYISICDFLNDLTDDSYIERVFDRNKQNKIQLELIGE